jgi:hypothetical protein
MLTPFCPDLGCLWAVVGAALQSGAQSITMMCIGK